MNSIISSWHHLEYIYDRKINQFMQNHIILGLLMVLLGVPLVILSGLILGTIIFILPGVFLLGWI